MATAASIERFLIESGVRYGVVTHQHSESSLGSVLAAKLLPDKVTKGVVLKENEKYALAVLPASYKLDLDWLRSQTGRPYQLARESEVERVFHDCAPGAVPAVAAVYGLETLVESSLREQAELYLEAGDHEELIDRAGVREAVGRCPVLPLRAALRRRTVTVQSAPTQYKQNSVPN